MTFGSTFGRVFSPTFQPSSQAAALSSALGSIAIDDLASGDITITLDETATDDLSTGTYVYDIQLITASSVKTLTSGKLVVTADVTRLVA